MFLVSRSFFSSLFFTDLSLDTLDTLNTHFSKGCWWGELRAQYSRPFCNTDKWDTTGSDSSTSWAVVLLACGPAEEWNVLSLLPNFICKSQTGVRESEWDRGRERLIHKDEVQVRRGKATIFFPGAYYFIFTSGKGDRLAHLQFG